MHQNQRVNAADVCVTPFIKEINPKIGLPALKKLEYLAFGKPTVASNVLGVKDLIESSGEGISVTLENPEELAAAVVKLVSDEKHRSLWGKDANISLRIIARMGLQERFWTFSMISFYTSLLHKGKRLTSILFFYFQGLSSLSSTFCSICYPVFRLLIVYGLFLFLKFSNFIVAAKIKIRFFPTTLYYKFLRLRLLIFFALDLSSLPNFYKVSFDLVFSFHSF